MERLERTSLGRLGRLGPLRWLGGIPVELAARGRRGASVRTGEAVVDGFASSRDSKSPGPAKEVGQ